MKHHSWVLIATLKVSVTLVFKQALDSEANLDLDSEVFCGNT